MRILSLSYTETETKWNIDQLEFLDNLTLLVGASGVGKTKILRAISNIRRIALDKVINKPVSWSIEFEHGDAIYRWNGCLVSTLNLELIEDDEKKIVFESESLMKKNKSNFEVIFNRTGNDIKFSNLAVPKLSLDKSLISMFSEEDIIKPIIDAFGKIFLFDFEIEKRLRMSTATPKEDDGVQLSKIQRVYNSNAPTILKLIHCYRKDKKLFNKIKEDFIYIFDRVEDVRVREEAILNISEDNKEKNETKYSLEIKESGTDWIDQSELSAGMYKTLLFISLLNLSPDDSIIIIDEFENSLGVNCIDLVAGQLLQNKKQFIITSHHPYIINKISYTHWRIVIRNANKVIVRSSDYYRLGSSNHEAFKELLNLDAFLEGCEWL